MKSTAQTTREKSIHGTSKTEKLAALILPILVRQAKAHNTITYSALAKEINCAFDDLHANPHGEIGHSLGIIGNTLDHMESPPPPINVCVVNKDTGEPSDGVNDFIKRRFPNYKENERPFAIRRLQEETFNYPGWDEVLKKLDLKPTVCPLMKEQPHLYQGGSGEGPEHKDFKDYVRNNPEKLHLPKNLTSSVECELKSGDRIDVVFENKQMIVGVEVKSHISNVDDIQRGLFQIVKYQAVLSAMESVSKTPRKVKVYLVLESAFPADLVPVRNTLGLEDLVVDSFRGPQK
jgi:hypothetical protein